MTTWLRAQPCPWCGFLLDMHSLVAQGDEPDASPEPGDFTLCTRCGQVGAYDADLRLRRLTLAENMEAARDDRVQKVAAAIRRLKQ